MTQTYPNQEATTAPSASRVASAARAASFKRASVYEYLVQSRLSRTRKLLLAGTGTNCRLFVEVNWDVVSVS
jgi:hypothetical protein